MSALPRGWAEATVEELGEWRGGGTPSKARDTFWRNGTIPWVSPKDMKRNFIHDAGDHITEHAVHGSATNLISVRSVLVVTRSGILRHSLPIAVNTREVAINQDLKALTPHKGIDAEFVAGQFRADAQAILADCAKDGTTVDSVDFTRLKNRRFRLAPFAEQRRIVAKLDALLDLTARARTDLDRVPILIAKCKKALLAAAFSGELTREWRDAEGLREAEHVPLGTLVTEIRYGTAQKCYPEPEGIAVLRIPNVFCGRIDLSDLKYTKLKPPEFDRLRLIAGDILIVRSNGSVDLVGRPALVTEAEAGLAYAGYLIRLRPDQNRVVPSYLSRMLEAPEIRRIIETGARSTSGVHNINSGELAALTVPRRELVEQHEIVRRVDIAFANLDRMGVEHTRAARLVPKLDQAILAKAFRGELVPQDPRDEPASELLARIRAKRADVPKRTRKAIPRAASEITTLVMEPAPLAWREQHMKKTRKDVPTNHLCEVVKNSGGKIRADALWHVSEMQIDEFYKLLREDIAAKRLKETEDKVSIIDAR